MLYPFLFQAFSHSIHNFSLFVYSTISPWFKNRQRLFVAVKIFRLLCWFSITIVNFTIRSHISHVPAFQRHATHKIHYNIIYKYAIQTYTHTYTYMVGLQRKLFLIFRLICLPFSCARHFRISHSSLSPLLSSLTTMCTWVFLSYFRCSLSLSLYRCAFIRIMLYLYRISIE